MNTVHERTVLVGYACSVHSLRARSGPEIRPLNTAERRELDSALLESQLDVSEGFEPLKNASPHECDFRASLLELRESSLSQQTAPVREGSVPRADESSLPSQTALVREASVCASSSHSVQAQRQGYIRPCYAIIGTGLVFIAGSLVPAVWRSVADNYLSGAFAMAQYILSVGVFVVGSMVAVHAKRCACWQGRHCFSVLVGGGAGLPDLVGETGSV